MSLTHAPTGTPILGIAGWKNSGKTTLVVRLVAEFTRRGLRVATLKHAHHAFDVDPGETDSARHRRAGAGQIAIVSSQRMALITEFGDVAEPPLLDVIAMLAPSDIILVEGYKTAPIRKIEVRRTGSAPGRLLAMTDPYVIAIASDLPASQGGHVPGFHLDAIEALADFLTTELKLERLPTPR